MYFVPESRIVLMLLTGAVLGGIWVMFKSKSGSALDADPVLQVKAPQSLSAQAQEGHITRKQLFGIVTEKGKGQLEWTSSGA